MTLLLDTENLTLVTDDGQFGPYGVPLLW